MPDLHEADSIHSSYTSLPARKSGQFSLLQGSDAFNETVATFSLTESVRFSCKVSSACLSSDSMHGLTI